MPLPTHHNSGDTGHIADHNLIVDEIAAHEAATNNVHGQDFTTFALTSSLGTIASQSSSAVSITGGTISGVTLTSTAATITAKDTLFTLQDDGDTSKQFQFDLSQITTATTRTYRIPDTGTSTPAFVLDKAAQTMTNKTHAGPIIQTNAAASLAVTFRGEANTAFNDLSRSNLIEVFGSPTTNPNFAFLHQSGTDASPSATSSGSTIARISARGYSGAAFATGSGATILMVADETVSTSVRGTRITFQSTPVTTTTLTESLRCTSSANVDVAIRSGLAVGAGATMAAPVSGYGIEVKSGAIGYGTGAGGAVTQATSRTTGVTLNTVCGSITLVSAAGSAAYNTFTVTNSTVAATDVVRVSQKSGTDKYIIHVTATGAGTFDITFATTGGTTTEQPVFNFTVMKAVTS